MEIPQQMPLVNEMYEAAARSRGTPRDYLGMSGIGDPCSLKIWLGFRGYTPVPIEGRSVMIFDMGNRVEDAVIHWIQSAGYKVEGRQDSFSEFNGYFRGHCDGIIHGVTSRPHILEIKSANAKKFSSFREHGIPQVSPTYAAQVQCYMGYAHLERAIWVVMNKDTCELYTERVHFDRSAFEALHKKAGMIITAQDPPDPEESALCQWCDYRLLCQTDDHIQTRKTCGTCVYLAAGLPMRCNRHDCELKTWGIACPDWILRYPQNDSVPF